MTADNVAQTVLVLGGYGFFGHRICAALARNPALRVLIAGRDITRATTAARSLGLPPEQAVCLNAQAPDLANYLRRLQVDILIHTAGPFQGQDYTVARAAIDAGCHYIDLADGREFVAGITALDVAAKEHGLTITSGASSVPALSSAVVDRYLPEFERLDAIRIGISSGARAPGLATVRGVFSYAGKPVRVLQDGSWATAFGWRGLERHQFPSPLGRNHGPFIPCGASIVLANKIADGVKLPAGAMPCMGLLSVAEYIDALRGLDVKEVIE